MTKHIQEDEAKRIIADLKAGLSCRAIAEVRGYSPQTINNLMRGKTFPGLKRPKFQDRMSRKLSDKQAVAIRKRAAKGEHPADIAESFDVAESSVFRILNGSRFADAGGPMREVRKRATVTPELLGQVRRMAADGMPQRKIATMLGISAPLVNKLLRDKSWQT